nr:NAD(P)H-hydrate epimerase [Acidobacteriota bacterium]
MKILTAQQMRELDRLTVERCGIPYATLMETAGNRVIEAIVEHLGTVSGKRFAVYCGKGNNGGDGAVIARLLAAKGAEQVVMFLLGSIEETKGEARANFDIIFKLNEDAYQHGRLMRPFLISQVSDGEDPSFFDLGSSIVVDALLGTGLTRPAEGLYAKAISSINGLREDRRTIVSVDIPSGLSSDQSHPIGPHVQADLTVSFTAPKIGNVLSPACEANGKLVIASIGTPDWLIEEAPDLQLELVEERQIQNWLNDSRRTSHAHKNSVGDVLLIAGSRGKTGAAALSSETVLRAGAGLVTVATSKSAQTLLVTQTRAEVMTEALAETFDGAISQEAVKQALQLAQKKTVIAIGPGLSSSDESTRAFVRELVEQRTALMVIDADALNALAPWPEVL